MSDLTGTWLSYYEYGQGPDNEPQTSEHRVAFVQGDNNTWTGTSLPNDEGSELTITVRQNGNEFQGDWHERSSLAGSYAGREFGGVILLLLQSEGVNLNGMWLGASSTTGEVKSGAWTLQREAE